MTTQNRTQQLTTVALRVFAENSRDIAELPRRGPRGGIGVENVEGWWPSPSANITRAVNASITLRQQCAQMWIRPYDMGLAIPTRTVYAALIVAEHEIFAKKPANSYVARHHDNITNTHRFVYVSRGQTVMTLVGGRGRRLPSPSQCARAVRTGAWS